jgi:hypothetical protein
VTRSDRQVRGRDVRRAQRWSAILLASVALLFAACSESTTSAAPLVLCVVPLAVTVTELESTPRYRWAPACGATYLEVTSGDGGAVLWIVRGDSGKIAPGVRYGQVPQGYSSRLGPDPLVRGRSYRVRVGIMVEENSFAIFGEQEFVY